MPGRLEPIVEGNIYHIFNKTMDSRSVFVDPSNSERYLQLLRYYRSSRATVSFSTMKKLESKVQEKIARQVMHRKYFMVNILAFCLMPTHFHLLLRQCVKSGISKFVADVTNSFTRYFNLKNKRKGPIFMFRFKAERVKSEAQLIHVARYIELNPYSSQVIKSVEDLEEYPWSSYREHVAGAEEGLCDDRETILGYFNFEKEKYKDFVLQQADYQRFLERMKYLEG